MTFATTARLSAQLPAYPEAVRGYSPLFYWRLGESSGTTAADSSGNGRDGTYTNTPTLGATGLLAGDPDKSVDFDSASSEYVTIADAAWMDVTAATVTCLVNLDSASGPRAIVSRYEEGAGSSVWMLYVNTSPAYFRWFASSGLSNFTICDSALTPSTGTTYYLAGYSSSSTCGIRVYTSSGLAASATGTARSLGASDRPIYAARAHGTNTYYTDGRIDEVSMFGSVLSTTDIDRLAGLALTGSPF